MSERINIISCGRFGTIELIRTNKNPIDIVDQLTYDADCKLWRASTSLALEGMKRTRRNCDLTDWNIAYEFV